MSSKHTTILIIIAALSTFGLGLGTGYLLWHKDCKQEIIVHDKAQDQKVDSTLQSIKLSAAKKADSIRLLSKRQKSEYLHRRLASSVRDKKEAGSTISLSATGQLPQNQTAKRQEDRANMDRQALSDTIVNSDTTTRLSSSEVMNLLEELSQKDEFEAENKVLTKAVDDLRTENDKLSNQAVTLNTENVALKAEKKTLKRQRFFDRLALVLSMGGNVYQGARSIGK